MSRKPTAESGRGKMKNPSMSRSLGRGVDVKMKQNELLAWCMQRQLVREKVKYEMGHWRATVHQATYKDAVPDMPHARTYHGQSKTMPTAFDPVICDNKTRGEGTHEVDSRRHNGDRYHSWYYLTIP